LHAKIAIDLWQGAVFNEYFLCEEVFMGEVLVVGAGPVGLTVAAELARHGVGCRVIDRLHEPVPYCRAIGVTPRTLEVWDDMGIGRRSSDLLPGTLPEGAHGSDLSR
jgi:2-polyprenyl-6-methoxyphenol hydroxylase-like FAD-dependent oxidoreductase